MEERLRPKEQVGGSSPSRGTTIRNRDQSIGRPPLSLRLTPASAPRPALRALLVEATTVRALDGPARVGTPRRQGRTTEELLRGFSAVLVLSLSIQRDTFADRRRAGFSALLAIAGRMAAIRRRWPAESETPFSAGCGGPSSARGTCASSSIRRRARMRSRSDAQGSERSRPSEGVSRAFAQAAPT